jgi:hypothetical protein
MNLNWRAASLNSASARLIEYFNSSPHNHTIERGPCCFDRAGTGSASDSTVPEPASALLFLLAIVATLNFRRIAALHYDPRSAALRSLVFIRT